MKISVRCPIKDRAIPSVTEDPVSVKRKVSSVTRKSDLSSNRCDNVCVQTAFFYLIEIQYLTHVGFLKMSRYFGQNTRANFLILSRKRLAFLMEMNQSHTCESRLLRRKSNRDDQYIFRDYCLWLAYVNFALNVKLRTVLSMRLYHVRSGIHDRNRGLRPRQLKIIFGYAMPMNEPDAEVLGSDRSQYQVSCVLHEFIRT